MTKKKPIIWKAILITIGIVWAIFFIIGNLITLHDSNECGNMYNKGAVFLNYIFLNFRCIHDYSTFNPDRDVCEEWECCVKYEYNEGAIMPSVRIIESCLYRSQNCSSSEYSSFYNGKCNKWRPKNKCELNPEAEGCVCDEYEKILLTVYRTINNTDILNLSVTSVTKWVKIETVNQGNDYLVYQILPDCIKSHLPNECEKGNPEYIVDLTKPCVCRDDLSGKSLVGSNETFYCKNVDCSMNCRKKTISDLSCEELWEHGGFETGAIAMKGSIEYLREYINRCGN